MKNLKNIVKMGGFFLLLACPALAQEKQEKPSGMVWVNGGTTKIGNEQGAPNEKPTFETHVAGFWIDTRPVTVGEFKKFVRFTRYITTAEKRGFGMCYDSTKKEWQKTAGANWQNPTGKRRAASDEPVRQVSWFDAQAYANWVGKRLPSELEWERALQRAEYLKLAYAQAGLWQWCENWFFQYEESGYFTQQLNRPKSLRAGKNITARRAEAPEETSENIGFRCVKEKE